MLGNVLFLLLFLFLFIYRFNNTTLENTRKVELFDLLVDKALKPLTENSRDYFQILDSIEMSIALVNVIEELKTVVNQYAFCINYNYYLCEKSDFHTDFIIKEKVIFFNFFHFS